MIRQFNKENDYVPKKGLFRVEICQCPIFSNLEPTPGYVLVPLGALEILLDQRQC